jgi:hypothetical protein
MDITPPDSQVVLPAEGAWVKGSFTVSWTGFDNYSSIAAYHLQYKITDNGTWELWNINGSSWTTQTSAIFTVPQGIPDGTTIYFRCRAQDAAGNLEEWPTEPDYDTYVRVDLTPPSAPNLVSPANGSATNDSTPTFNWSDVFDISGITYEINVYDSVGISKGRLISSEFTPIESLPSDVYSWRVKAIDGAGNVGPWSEVWTVVIDTASPGISSTYQVSRKDGTYVDGVLWTNTKTPSLRVTVQDVLSGLDVNSAKYLYKTENSDCVATGFLNLLRNKCLWSPQLAGVNVSGILSLLRENNKPTNKLRTPISLEVSFNRICSTNRNYKIHR